MSDIIDFNEVYAFNFIKKNLDTDIMRDAIGCISKDYILEICKEASIEEETIIRAAHINENDSERIKVGKLLNLLNAVVSEPNLSDHISLAGICAILSRETLNTQLLYRSAARDREQRRYIQSYSHYTSDIKKRELRELIESSITFFWQDEMSLLCYNIELLETITEFYV